MVDVLLQDVRYAVRSLARRPLITSVAVLSLALGIGVNTAIFSVFERFLLLQLPVPAPQDIVHVTSPGPKPGFTASSDGGGEANGFSLPLLRDIERVENGGVAAVAEAGHFAAR